MLRRLFVCAVLVLAGLWSNSALAVGPQSPHTYTAADGIVGKITEFLVVPDNDTVGAMTDYRLKFILDDDSLPSGAMLELDFPAYFDVSEIDSIVCSNNDGDSSQMSVVSYELEGLHLSVRLDSVENHPEPGTQITLTIYGLVSATTADSYQVLLAVVRSDGQLVALPRLSEPFTLKPAPLSQFAISPKGLQQIHAGESIVYSVSRKDQYGNIVPGGPVTWGVIGSAGTLQGNTFVAQFVGAAKVFASYQTFADTTAYIYVLPGDLSYFDLTGGADSAVAGQFWKAGADDIVVTARDLYGNVCTDFDGAVYFNASDPTATLPYTSASRYTFTVDDQGVRIFPGNGFRFTKAGRHMLSLMMNGEEKKSIYPIAIIAAAPTSYNLNVPTSAVAGTDFQVQISGAIDAFGNSVSGRTDISLQSGSGASPSGVLPSLPSFYVQNGFGSGTTRLVKTGNTTLVISLSGVISVRTVAVAPAAMARFRFEMDPTQPINQPFVGKARLTALDAYENVAVGFSAFTDTVRITSDGAGTMYSDVLGAPDAFLAGICDLTRFGTRYDGLESFVRFTATSKSGITGQSPEVGLSLLKITRGEFAQEYRYLGEQYSFSLTIANFGTQPATVNAIRLYGNGSRLQPVAISPPLNHEIAPLTNEVFTLTGAVPNLPNQVLSVDAVFAAQLGTGIVKDSATALDQLTILPAEGVSVVAGTLTPIQVTAGRSYAFAITVRNESDDDLRLATTTTMSIPFAGGADLNLQLPAAIVVGGNGGSTQLTFPMADLPEIDSQTVGTIGLQMVGSLGTVAFDQTFPVVDEIMIQTPPQIAYRSGTLAPEVLYRGTDVALSLGVKNSGTATLAVDLAASGLTLFAGERQFTARLDANSLQLLPGDANLLFKSITIPQDIGSEVDSFVIAVSGTANGHSESSRFTIPGSAVAIPFGAAVKLMSVTLEMRNPPYVNLGQSFKLLVDLRNTGDEPLSDIKLRLASNGNSSFVPDKTILELGVSRDTTVEYSIEAAFQSTISELFSATVLEATGATSGLAALVESPQGSPTAVVVIQTPASLNLESQIAAPVSAQDGIVGLGESFSIAASVLNAGQATVGSGELTLSVVEGNFVINGAVTQTFSVGEQVEWMISAPPDDDTGRIVIAITATPDDDNLGSAARLLDRADTIRVICSESQVAIGVDFTAPLLQLLTPGKSYDVLNLSFDIVGEAEQPYLTFLEFEIHDRDDEIVAPGTVLTGAQLNYNNQGNLAGVIGETAVRFNLGSGYGIPRSGTLSLTIAANPELQDFSLYLDSNSIAAAYETAAGTKPVPISARFASDLMIERQFTLVAQALSQSFFCYPNPFSPIHERAALVYNLSTARAATLKIYTLHGEEVITREIPPPASLAEPVTVYWDGRNQDGQIVLNGVYVAVLSVDGEGEVRTKIAVVK